MAGNFFNNAVCNLWIEEPRSTCAHVFVNMPVLVACRWRVEESVTNNRSVERPESTGLLNHENDPEIHQQAPGAVSCCFESDVLMSWQDHGGERRQRLIPR